MRTYLFHLHFLVTSEKKDNKYNNRIRKSIGLSKISTEDKYQLSTEHALGNVCKLNHSLTFVL